SSIFNFAFSAAFSASLKNFTIGDFHSSPSTFINASPFAPKVLAISVSSSLWPIVSEAKLLALIAFTTPPASSAPRKTLKVLRLPISAQIFVPKTFRDLKIFFDAGNLKELLVLLGRLGQRVKFSRHQSARDQEIARAFRRALGQNRRLDFEITLRIEKIARRFRSTVTNAQIARELRPAQIVIAIGQAQIFVVNLGVHRKWQIIRAIQNSQLSGNQFDVASGKFRIFRSRNARRDFAENLNHVFAPQSVSFFGQRGIFLGTENDLRQAFAVAQIDKNDAAVIARNMDPTGKSGVLTDVDLAKRIAIVCAIHVQ